MYGRTAVRPYREIEDLMTIPTYPSSLNHKIQLPFELKPKYNTLISDYDSGGDQTQRLWRFAKLTMPPAEYRRLTVSERNTLSDFFRSVYGRHKPFWFFDLNLKHWTDLYVGQGGPLTVGGALQYTASTGIFVDETDHANDATVGDVNILPAAGAGNAYLIGSPTQFDKVTFTISTPGAGTYTITGKYWNGTALTTITLTDGTTNFKAAAGDRDVTFTIPTDWIIDERGNFDQYWLWFIADGGTVTTPPVVTKITVNSKTYDLPSKTTTNDATLITYIDGVVTAKTFVSGGGGGGADRVLFGSYPAQGSLISADLNGFLRAKAKFSDDEFPEKNVHHGWHAVSLGLREVQW